MEPKARATRGSTSHSPSHFFKIILPSTIENMKLRIPPKFVLDFGDELSTLATLTVPNSGTWKVRLLKAEGSIWFCNGWEDFVEYYSISVGHLLVFRYERNSTFHVIILDKTATETQYPSNKNVNLEDLVDLTELDDINISMHDKQPSDTSSKGRERAIQAAKLSMPKGRSFMAVMQPYNIRFHYVYVPKKFADKYIAWDQSVNLQTCGEKQWLVQCYWQTGASSSLRIGKGWEKFSKENHLEEGDVCVFEVIKTIATSPVVLIKVSIFHVNDNAVN